MSGVRNLLSNYFAILEEDRTAKYLECRYVPVTFDGSESTDTLWKKHDTALKKIKLENNQPKQSLLDLKIELASRIFRGCYFCERRCGVDRTKGSGNCGVMQTRVYSEFLHIGEEEVLVPSHTIFFSGCSFHCVFCQNWDISQLKCGTFIEPVKLAEIIHERKTQGSKNVNWVGGDPTPNVLYILETLRKCKDNVPQVWNSNMYCSTETMSLLDGVIDVYLTDFKYGNNKCARCLSEADNYLEVVKRNHKIAHGKSEMIIRHLVMPNHIDCCSKPILDWISKNLPSAVVNIMGQYRPEYHSFDYDDISRHVSRHEFLQVKKYASKLNIHQI